MNTYKILIHTVVFFVLSTILFSQEAVEIKEKRTANSKTYDNGNGSYTLEISLDNLHYKDDKDELKKIKKDFTASLKEDYTYEVTEGLYKVYIKEQSKEKKTQKFLTREGYELNFSLNAMGYYNQNSGEFKAIQEIEDVKLQINKNKALYKDIIKGIDVEYIYQSDRLKENIYISQKARVDLPDPSGYGFKAEDTWLMFRSELDYSRELYVFQDNKDITGQDYETTSRLEFNVSEGETAFYFANDLASFIPEKGNPEYEEEIPVLKRIYSVGDQQNFIYGVPLKWISSLPEGDVIIDPSVVLNTPQTCQEAYVYKWLGDLNGTIYNNYGSSGVLLADTWTKNGILRYYRSYIKFDFSALPAQAKITGAQLTLTNDGYPHAGGTTSRYENATTFLSRVTEPWNEYQITWDNQPQVDANNQVDVDAPSDAYASMDEDVTNLVKDILNSEEGNHGFQLKLQDEVVYNQVRYASSQNTDSNRWPELTITYTEMQEAYYLKDHLGNIRVTLDGNGEVITTDDYYPFGLQMPGRSFNIALTGDLYKYNAKELDKEGGLDWQYYNPWRYRDPVTTRWLVVDPLYADYPSLSPYVYVANNPIILIDPDGRWFTHWDEENGAYSDVGVGEFLLKQFNSAIENISSSIEHAITNFPEFVAEGTVNTTKEVVQTTVKLAEDVTGIGIKTSDVVSRNSEYATYVGLGITGIGLLSLNPVITGAGLKITAASVSIGTYADGASLAFKTIDASFFSGSRESAVNQLGVLTSNAVLGKVYTRVPKNAASMRFWNQGYEILSKYIW